MNIFLNGIIEPFLKITEMHKLFIFHSLLGNNTFGFKDLPNLGDKDFNDMIVKVNLSIIQAGKSLGTRSQSRGSISLQHLSYNFRQGDRIALNSLPSSVFNGGVFSTSTLSGSIDAAYADVNPNLAGNQALDANQAVFFGWDGGKYVSVNDGLAPFNANTDLFINVTGMTGTMATGALTPTNYFAVQTLKNRLGDRLFKFWHSKLYFFLTTSGSINHIKSSNGKLVGYGD